MTETIIVKTTRLDKLVSMMKVIVNKILRSFAVLYGVRNKYILLACLKY